MKGTKILLASIMGITMIAGAPMMASAQQQDEKTVTLDMQQADVREVLRALFKSMNVSYSVAPSVQGLVTLNVRNVPFETALQNILKQVTATYRVVGGVYEVIPREEQIPVDPTPTDPIAPGKSTVRRKVFVRAADPQFLSILISGSQTNFNLHPEISTVLGSGGGNGGGFGNGNNFGGSNSGSQGQFGGNQGFNGSQGQNGGNRGGQRGNGPRGG